MSSSVALDEALATAPDERARAKVIAEAFEQLEERYPNLSNLATQGHVRETELRLQKEIEQVRADLSTQIERIKSDLLRWLLPIMLAQVAAIAAMVKLL
ncbi:DUF1640 domain-containing protein [Thiorhodococcus mannitoliphagus]|uniref:DUF1640 domain-containing protein n=1 Tax=Thiorhodococcus mannitoliphagus TaxID=329406 RepID=A0A6P1DZJ7_9GAMM|nr:DUF1640 domain-containing protein [Thiorhodococcus mannitoliphagus]NEX22910.1 DUF1640 domain-containing protein [Thiorhodococcus mannitoliphagus]